MELELKLKLIDTILIEPQSRDASEE